MRLSDLDLRELLEFEPRGGIIRFAGQRAVILDAVALGLLRKELIATVGFAGARGILTRFGYVHGWRTAESLKEGFPWDSAEDWRLAGGKLHTLQGLMVFERVSDNRDREKGSFAEAIWRESYEAEQHILHFGLAEAPVCWTLCGFATGYLTCCNGREIYCLEERCRGRGDSLCHMVAQTREEWGHSAAEDLAFYLKESLDDTLHQVTEALKRTERRLRSRRRALSRTLSARAHPSGMVAHSEAMKRVTGLALRVAKFDATVLITGESGSGKKRLARLMHDESHRDGGPFVTLSCSGMPEGLQESELFGHVRNTSQGASDERMGIFEAAHGGTLVLDGVGDLFPAAQAKLLRVLEENEVGRVGDSRKRPLNARVIGATDQDLAELVNRGRFRRALYDRLRGVEIRVPALRERRDDILPLARLLLVEAARRLGRRVTGLSPKAAERIWCYDWPGNVNELENAMDRAVMLADGNRVEIDHLPDEVRAALPGAFAPGRVRSLAEVEREYILAVLDANQGHQKNTAAQLKIGTATLYRKLKQYQASEVN